MPYLSAGLGVICETKFLVVIAKIYNISENVIGIMVNCYYIIVNHTMLE